MRLLLLLALCESAWADVAPSPERPDWDEPPAPLPLPPEALVTIALALAVGGVGWALRGTRAPAADAP